MRTNHEYSQSSPNDDEDEEGGFTKEALDTIDAELELDLDLEDDNTPASP